MTAQADGPNDRWADADLYTAYVGRWSALVAPKFLAWLAAPHGGRWLDVGCGPGTLTRAILEGWAPAAVVGVDPSARFVEAARARIRDPRASFVVGKAEALAADFSRFDAAVAGLVLNFVPDPAIAVREMAATVAAGGLVGAYVWDYADGMQMMRHFWDAAAELDPAAAELDEGRRFPEFGSRRMPDLFAAELAEVEATAIVIDTPFASFDDYWRPFEGGQGPAPTYAVSLDEGRRARLRDRLRSALPTAADGSIALTARVWAAKGRRRA